MPSDGSDPKPGANGFVPGSSAPAVFNSSSSLAAHITRSMLHGNGAAGASPKAASSLSTLPHTPPATAAKASHRCIWLDYKL